MYGSTTCMGAQHVWEHNMYGSTTCMGAQHVWGYRLSDDLSYPRGKV